MGKERTSTKVIDRVKFKKNKSKKYSVVVLNNDRTTFDAVIDVLVNFFRKTEAEAMGIANVTHVTGESVVETGLTKDIAHLKIQKALSYCIEQEYKKFGNNYKLLKFEVKEVK